MDSRTAFTKKIIHLIRSIPRGKVASYGQLAKLAGKPHGARGVAWILHSSSRVHALPWQRVLNSKGRISFPEDSYEYARQKKLLENEGVVFMGGKIGPDFFWKKKPSARRFPGRQSGRR